MSLDALREYGKDCENYIKQYFSSNAEVVEEIYGIKVPKNICNLKGQEFLDYIQSIQNQIYNAVSEMEVKTPLYYQINQFLFCNGVSIEINTMIS